MSRQADDRLEVVLAAQGCPEDRHRPHMRACAWRGDRACACRVRVAIDDLLGGRVEE